MNKKSLLAVALVGLALFGTILVLIVPKEKSCSSVLNRKQLEQSLELGKRFLLNNQLPEGNFTYQYDWIQKKYAREDNAVRQAGATWGLALIYQYQPSAELQQAVERGLAFFERHSQTDAEGRRYVVYPGDLVGSTGTVALTALAHIDFLREAEHSLPKDRLEKLQQHLGQYLAFLASARHPDGRWHSHYRHDNGKPYGPPSPYADGEALLALVKAANYQGKESLWKIIFPAAQAGYQLNVVAALKKDPDSPITKGYYQWSSMAFFEIAISGKPNTEQYGDYILSLADWMIDVHRILKRTRNTAYAFEGIIHAYELAHRRQLGRKEKKFRCVIERGLEKLTSWQVGHPIANPFIAKRPTEDPKAIGGIQNHREEAPLRIDVTQHQMHAVILALKYAFSAEDKS